MLAIILGEKKNSDPINTGYISIKYILFFENGI